MSLLRLLRKIHNRGANIEGKLIIIDKTAAERCAQACRFVCFVDLCLYEHLMRYFS